MSDQRKEMDLHSRASGSTNIASKSLITVDYASIMLR